MTVIKSSGAVLVGTAYVPKEKSERLVHDLQIIVLGHKSNLLKGEK